jgi:hypothetical protein
MKIALLVASLAFAAPLNGQIASAVAASREGSAIRVRNDGALALSAIALRAQWKLRGNWPQAALDMAKVPAKIYLDSLIDPSAATLAPHEERILDRGNLSLRMLSDPRVTIAEPFETAGIFADGSTTGDQSLLALLLLRRSNMLLAADTAIDILSEAAKHNVPPSWLTGQFRRLSLSHFYLLPEQEAGRSVYESILAKLINLPDAPLGTAFPPTEFAENEIAGLRQLRAALVDSRPNLEQVARLR